MNLTDAIKNGFTNYVNFKGRATRPEYWYFILFTFLAGIATSIIDAIIVGPDSDLTPVSTLFNLAVLLPSLGLAVRRLHDSGRSAWNLAWYATLVGGLILGITALFALNPALAGFFFLIAFAGPIVLIVLFCQPSTPGTNQYGELPAHHYLNQPVIAPYTPATPDTAPADAPDTSTPVEPAQDK